MSPDTRQRWSWCRNYRMPSSGLVNEVQSVHQQQQSQESVKQSGSPLQVHRRCSELGLDIYIGETLSDRSGGYRTNAGDCCPAPRLHPLGTRAISASSCLILSSSSAYRPDGEGQAGFGQVALRFPSAWRW